MSNINVAYKLLDYIRSTVQAIEPAMNFYPGDSAPQQVGHAFGLYQVTQNQDFYIRGLGHDAMQLQIIHVKFDTAQKIVTAIQNLINIDSPQGVITGSYVENTITYNVRFMETFATVIGTNNDFFIDNTQYYAQKLLINYDYTTVTLAQ